MRKPQKGHHGHAYCGGLCVPHWLHEQFEEQLGAKAQEFDLLAWYPRRDAQRRLEGTVSEEPLTFWREEFRTELAFRGWLKPKYKPIPLGKPVDATKMATFGRSTGEIQKAVTEYMNYKNTHHNSE